MISDLNNAIAPLTREKKEEVFVDIHKENRNEQIAHVRLHNRNITVDVTNIGCAITGIYAPDRKQIRKNIVAAHNHAEHYLTNKDYFGVVVGRYANRIAGGRFSIDGNEYQLTVNNDHNHLHGGVHGLSHKIWTLAQLQQDGQECRVKFTCTSPDGEEGYPGDLDVSVEYILDAAGKLHIQYEATTNKSTPVNLTNHTYFNLTGFEDASILHHYLQVNADHYTEKNECNTSSGNIKTVNDTAFDFRTARTLGERITGLGKDKGYDQNYVLQKEKDEALTKAATLYEATSGRMVNVYTTAPGMQVYTANYWDGTIIGIQGVAYPQHGAVALETQAYPDSVRFPHFPCTILRPGEVYRSTTIFEFKVSDNV